MDGRIPITCPYSILRYDFSRQTNPNQPSGSWQQRYDVQAPALEPGADRTSELTAVKVCAPVKARSQPAMHDTRDRDSIVSDQPPIGPRRPIIGPIGGFQLAWSFAATPQPCRWSQDRDKFPSLGSFLKNHWNMGKLGTLGPRESDLLNGLLPHGCQPLFLRGPSPSNSDAVVPDGRNVDRRALHVCLTFAPSLTTRYGTMCTSGMELGTTVYRARYL